MSDSSYRARKVVYALIDEGIVPASLAYSAKEVIEILWQDEMCITWCIEDVKMTGESMNIEISDRYARFILSRMSDKHDASLGVNWGTIQYWIEETHASYEGENNGS